MNPDPPRVWTVDDVKATAKIAAHISVAREQIETAEAELFALLGLDAPARVAGDTQ